jgi:hypothetical protein
MQSKTVFVFPANLSPASFSFYLRSVWALSKKDFLCAPTKGAKGEMFFSTKKYFLTTTKLRHFSTFLSMVSDGIHRHLNEAEVKREALKKRYQFVTQMKEMMKEYNVAGSMGVASPIFEFNYSDAISIENFIGKVYGAMKDNIINNDIDEMMKRFDANISNLNHLKELAKTAHSDAELLLDMALNPSSMDSIYLTKEHFEGFMMGFLDVINTGESFPSILYQAERCSNSYYNIDNFCFSKYLNRYDANIELLDGMIDDIMSGDYDSFNEESEEHLSLNKQVDTLGPVIVDELTKLFQNVIEGYHFFINEDDEIEIKALD